MTMAGRESCDSSSGVSAATYLAEGNYLYKHNDYRKALKKYNKSLEMCPDDVSARLARSSCHLALGNSDKALEDAEAAMKQTQGPSSKKTGKGNPMRNSTSPWKKKIAVGHSTNWKTLYQKAEALFYLGDYEAALMLYHRGQHMRPNAAEFRVGIQRCEDVISKMCATTPRRKEDDIFHLDDETTNQSERPVSPDHDHVLDLDHVTKLQDHSSFLHRLMCDINPSLVKGEEIHDLARHTMNYCQKRSKFWRQRMPATAAQDAVFPVPEDSGAPYHYALRELSRINDDMKDSKYEECISRAERCIRTLKQYKEEDLENKYAVLATLYSYMGLSYTELDMHDMALRCHNKDLTLAKKRQIFDAEARALENIGRVYVKMGDYEKSVEIWHQRLSYHDTDQKRAWLYHELGYCHLSLLRHEKARQCADKAYEHALKAADVEWQLNASTLIAQTQVVCHEYDDAADTFRRALELAQLQEDEEAIDVIKQALKDVDDAILEKAKHDSDSGSIASTAMQRSESQQEPETTKSPDGSEHGEVENEAEVNEPAENEAEQTPKVVTENESPGTDPK